MQKNRGGHYVSLSLLLKMIDKVVIENLVTECLTDTDCYLVEVKISPSNQIVVEIDSDTIVDIDLCVKISRHIDENMDRDVEDFELEVGSCGITSPFKLVRQYMKNIGNEVEVLADGQKMTGILVDANENDFSVDVQVKEKGKKKPVIVTKTFEYKNVKYTKYNLKFN